MLINKIERLLLFRSDNIVDFFFGILYKLIIEIIYRHLTCTDLINRPTETLSNIFFIYKLSIVCYPYTKLFRYTDMNFNICDRFVF